MTLHIQQQSSFSYLRSRLPFLRFVLCTVIGTTHSTDEQRRSRVENHFRLLNLCVKKECKVRNLHFVLPQVETVRINKDGSGGSIKTVSMEISWLVIDE